MSDATDRPLSPRNPAGAFRHAALAIRRNIRSAVPDPGFCLRQRRAMRGAVQGRRNRLSVFALFQSQRLDVRAPHDRARRRGRRARHRNRHGRGDHRDPGAAEGRRSRGRGESDVRLLPLCGGRSAAALRHRLDAGRRPRSRAVEAGDAAEHQELLSGKPDQPHARRARYRRHRRDRACRRRAADRRQCVCDADLAEPAATRRRRRGVFGDQAHRRTRPLSRRHHPVLGAIHRRPHPHFPAPDRPVDVAVQRVGVAEGTGDAGDPRARADRDCRRPLPMRWRPIRKSRS